MRFKTLLYVTIFFLALSCGCAILKIFLPYAILSNIFELGMACSQIAGLLLIITNGKFIKNKKLLLTFAIFAFILAAGYLLQKVAMLMGIFLQLLGMLLILILYAKSFFDKTAKKALDYLKLMWLSTKVISSILFVSIFGAAIFVKNLSNILFYTMLIYFVWLSISHKIQESENENEQPSAS